MGAEKRAGMAARRGNLDLGKEENHVRQPFHDK
jgi:hypothetical protein